MTTTIQPPTPRPRLAPSHRDQQIYLDYQSSAKRQSDLATEHNLTQCRISQIVRRVDRWLAAEPVHSAERQQLDHRLQRQRLNFVCREAMRQFSAERKTVTHKTGTRGNQKIDETTERREPPSIQCLKVILQANAQFDRLANRPPQKACVEPQPQPRQVEVPLDSFPVDDSAGADTDVQWEFPDVPPVNGWYSPVRDERGWIISWERTEHQTPDSYIRQTGFPEPADPPTCSDAENAHSSTCALPTESPQTSASDQLAPPAPNEETSPAPVKALPAPAPDKEQLDPLERRVRHYEKLHELREAQRSGRPYRFYFDAEDGPLPPAPPYVLDGAPCP